MLPPTLLPRLVRPLAHLAALDLAVLLTVTVLVLRLVSSRLASWVLLVSWPLP
jgi:hypothetical protein